MLNIGRGRRRELPNYYRKKQARETVAKLPVEHTLRVTFGIHGTTTRVRKNAGNIHGICTTVRRKKRGKRLRNFRLRMRTPLG